MERIFFSFPTNQDKNAWYFLVELLTGIGFGGVCLSEHVPARLVKVLASGGRAYLEAQVDARQRNWWDALVRAVGSGSIMIQLTDRERQ